MLNSYFVNQASTDRCLEGQNK